METIASLLITAKASAVMIVENIFGQTSPEYIAAMVAIAAAENHPHPATNLKAEQACMAFLASNTELAMSAINNRIARRAAANL